MRGEAGAAPFFTAAAPTKKGGSGSTTPDLVKEFQKVTVDVVKASEQCDAKQNKNI